MNNTIKSGSLRAALLACHLPAYECSVAELGADLALLETADGLHIRLALGVPLSTQREPCEAALQRVLDQAGITVASIELHSAIPVRDRSAATHSLQAVRHIIAVASGKGGVGKSATALNIALALRREGARVGLLDADIYGPSQPGMLGVPAGQKPEVHEEKYFLPIVAQGIATMSMGYLASEKTPMVWRGPMASGALMQMLQQTRWGELDYLLIDMPPGTGDIQLTLAQQIPCTGAVIVTTPQTVALLDAQKGIEMFRKVGIDCLGIVENMATHICSECGHEEAIFGSGGGARIAAEYGVRMLGSIPLDAAICESLDAGKSCVDAAPDTPIAQRYQRLARALAREVCARSAVATPELLISDD